jgi:hypothetical protein
VSFDKLHIAELVEYRRQAAARATAARAKGHITLADGFDRVVADWDAMLARNGVDGDAG